MGCSGRSTATLECPQYTLINIAKANYGRKDNKTCKYSHKNAMIDTKCSAPNSDNVVDVICEGKEKCEVQASSFGGTDPCHGTYKYVEIKYQCKLRGKDVAVAMLGVIQQEFVLFAMKRSKKKVREKR